MASGMRPPNCLKTSGQIMKSKLYRKKYLYWKGTKLELPCPSVPYAAPSKNSYLDLQLDILQVVPKLVMLRPPTTRSALRAGLPFGGNTNCGVTQT